jgi:hypothetical protein
MSALPPKADIPLYKRHVCFVPKAAIDRLRRNVRQVQYAKQTQSPADCEEQQERASRPYGSNRRRSVRLRRH